MNAGVMPQSNDPAIKLFGRKIPVVTETPIPANPENKDICGEVTRVETGDPNEYNPGELDRSSPLGHKKEERKTSMQVNSKVTSKPKEEQVESNSTDNERVFKKPDKILPCPRCNSLETKFCYFNNYNVNQPRHFCRNCQRYWTAGGTMRNVPIGAGRRKNKHLVSSDGMLINRMENSESANQQHISSVESASTLRPSIGNGLILKFGPEVPICESMETVLNLGDQKRYVELNEPSSCGSLTMASRVLGSEPENDVQRQQAGLPGSSNELMHPIHCYPVSPWIFPWNPAWNDTASVGTGQYWSGQACINGGNPTQVQFCPTPMLAVPGLYPPSIPLQFIPDSYWGCMPAWSAGPGNMMSSVSNGGLPSSSSASTSCGSGNGSPTLGKHSRDTNFMDEEKGEKCMVVPKTLRINDTNEASKSHLWAALGTKPDQRDFSSKGTVFKTLETKAVGRVHVSDTTHILEANPAALSRSHTFQESG